VRGARLLLALLLLPAALAAPGGEARAQDNRAVAHVTASVTVAPPPILLATTRDLYFGTVGRGQVVDVPAQPPYSAGTWSAGVRFSNLRKTVQYGIALTLPTALVKGSTSLPVSFSGTRYGWLCVWNATTSTAGSCDAQQTAFNPASYTAAGTYLLLDLPNNTPQNNVFAADVYVGGRLTIPDQPLSPGTYSAPVTVTISVLN
jgi:hypothetical protein